MKAVQINFSEDLLARLDADEIVRELGRSEVVRRMVEGYLRRRESQCIDESLIRGYGAGIPAHRGRARRLDGGGGGVARTVRRGDLWLYEFRSPDRRRPVLVLTREVMVNRLHTVTVAPITSTIRGTATEVRVGTFEGLKDESVVNLDHVQTVPRRICASGSEGSDPAGCSRSVRR